MLIGKLKSLSKLDKNESENKFSTFINDLKLLITIQLNESNVKAESRVLERLIKESLDDLPPATIFTTV